MPEIEVGKTISFRPAEYDVRILNMIQGRNPHILDTVSLIREALRRWEIEASDENSKSKRLDRIEKELSEIKAILVEWQNEHAPGR